MEENASKGSVIRDASPVASPGLSSVKQGEIETNERDGKDPKNTGALGNRLCFAQDSATVDANCMCGDLFEKNSAQPPTDPHLPFVTEVMSSALKEYKATRENEGIRETSSSNESEIHQLKQMANMKQGKLLSSLKS